VGLKTLLIKTVKLINKLIMVKYPEASRRGVGGLQDNSEFL